MLLSSLHIRYTPSLLAVLSNSQVLKLEFNKASHWFEGELIKEKRRRILIQMDLRARR